VQLELLPIRLVLDWDLPIFGVFINMCSTFAAQKLKKTENVLACHPRSETRERA
jgi:hypothetical protein